MNAIPGPGRSAAARSVPLRDTSALEEWARRDDPAYSVWRTVSEWVEGLSVAPWQAPSAPFPELSDLPHYEIRTAELAGVGGVEVFYRREYDGELIDLIWVGVPGEEHP